MMHIMYAKLIKQFILNLMSLDFSEIYISIIDLWGGAFLYPKAHNLRMIM